jgi:hypothetical protein
MSRRTEKWKTEQTQIAEHERMHVAELAVEADPIAASEAAHVAKMTSADAPAWAKVAVNTAHVPAPASRRDVTDRLAALEAEQAELRAKLEKSYEDQRTILNQQLADQAAAEEKGIAARELPNTLKATLQAVNEFVPPVDAPAAVVDPFDAAVQRGQDALDRAMRRMRGENVPEPEAVATPTPDAPKISPRQAAIMARIDPALVTANEMQSKLAEWSRAFGKAFDSLYVVGEDDANREIQLVNDLMRGLPSTTAELQSRSYQLVKGVLAGVRMAVQLKSTMSNTVERETQVLKRLLARVDRYGPMIVQNDFSADYYDLERELQTTLRTLGTVNEDGIEGLWKITADVNVKLQRITELRASVAGQPQPPLVWESKGAILDGARQAKTLERRDWDAASRGVSSTMPSVAVTGGPFDTTGGN